MSLSPKIEILIDLEILSNLLEFLFLGNFLTLLRNIVKSGRSNSIHYHLDRIRR